jgi:nucleoside 2-deoxyribosyltransferase
MFKVYLSGPISGLDYESAVSWTTYAETQLEWDGSSYKSGIVGYKPLRGKEFLKDHENLSAMGYETTPLSTAKGIFNRDRYDVMSCDAMLVNLLGAKRVSIGTMFEMAWAHAWSKPIVLVMENEGNFHEHCFVTESITYRTDNLDAGIALVKSILLP